MDKRRFHHSLLPTHSALLSGRVPPDEIGFQSDNLQIWFNNTLDGWVDDNPHFHEASDECFILLEGEIVMSVEGERIVLKAGEFCCFPAGMRHAIIETRPPIRSLMLRAPSIADKTYDTGERSR